MLLTINGGKCQGNIVRVREYGLWIMVLCNEKLGIFGSQKLVFGHMVTLVFPKNE